MSEDRDRAEEVASIEELDLPTREIAAGHLVLREPLDGALLDEHSARRGNTNHPLVLLWADLTDAKMPHAQNLLEKMFRRYDGRLQWGFRHLPQDQACNTTTAVTRNPGACRVAYAAQCSGAKFWEFFELLAKNPARFDELSLRSLLSLSGVKPEDSASCMSSQRVKGEVARDVTQAAALGLAGGRWVVDGRPLPLGINASGLDAAIRVALGETEANADGRVPARRMALIPTPAEVGTVAMRRVEEFYVDATEALIVRDGSARSVSGMVPASATWFEADEACRSGGKRLCTYEEWRRACSGERSSDWLAEGRRWPYSDIWSSTVCWDSGNTTRTAAFETGQKPYCQSPEGIYDLTGNVWEWVGNTPEEALLVGGSFLEGQGATCAAVLDGFGPKYSAPWTGFRCCASDIVEPTGAGLSPSAETSGGFPLPPSLKSSRVLVHVVRASCPVCARSTLALAELQGQGESTPVVVVGLGVNEGELERLLKPSGLQSTLMSDAEGHWTGALRVAKLPTTLVLAGSGKEQARMEGYSQLGWADLLGALPVKGER